jgi:hypothetical protein
MAQENVPGYEGSIGPGPRQYGKPHVYARDVHSGSGNCVCGAALEHRRHTEAAPGIPVPGRTKSGPTPEHLSGTRLIVNHCDKPMVPSCEPLQIVAGQPPTRSTSVLMECEVCSATLALSIDEPVKTRPPDGVTDDGREYWL